MIKMIHSIKVMGLMLFLGSFAHAAKQPNIILIMTDDVGQECFPAYGGEDYETPRLDEIAQKGMVFDHCYSQSLCTPSRVKIMTGKYMFRNYTHFGYLRPDQKTTGHLMKDAGYKTAVVGKWQLNGLYDRHPGHDDPTRPQHLGYDEYHLWQLTKGKNEGERFWNTYIETNVNPKTKEDLKGQYGPDLHRDFVLDFMERNKSEPFFIYYPMVLVHSPFLPTPDSKDLKCKDKKQNFVDMVKYTDKIIGQIIDKTESLGIAENTIILFTSDNGTHTSLKSKWRGEDFKGGKGSMKNSGNHVPFYAYWKGMTPTGARNQDLVDFSDFYATLADITQQKLTKENPIDGISFLPQLKGQENSNKRDHLLLHYTPFWGDGKNSGRSIRDQNFKLYHDGRYFNVPKDIHENHIVQKGSLGERAETKRSLFQEKLNRLPAFPKELGKKAKDRPLFPTWDPLD